MNQTSRRKVYGRAGLLTANADTAHVKDIGVVSASSRSSTAGTQPLASRPASRSPAPMPPRGSRYREADDTVSSA